MSEEKKKRGRPSKTDENSVYVIVRDPIMEPYFIQKDRYNFTVMERVTPTKGFAGAKAKNKELERTLGYYTTFRSALFRISKEKFKTKSGDYDTVKDYINEWEQVRNGLDTLLNSIHV
mgnify:FL=1